MIYGNGIVFEVYLCRWQAERDGFNFYDDIVIFINRYRWYAGQPRGQFLACKD